jgi:hypothetical protein
VIWVVFLSAINTEGIDEVQARWLAGTILKNLRQYGITVQYRIGMEGPFTIIPETDYIAGNDGHTKIKALSVCPHKYWTAICAAFMALPLPERQQWCPC